MAKAKVQTKEAPVEDPAADRAPRVSPGRAVRAIGRGLHRGMRGCLRWWRSILLTTLLVAALGFGGGYYYFVYRADIQTDAAARHQAVKAASPWGWSSPPRTNASRASGDAVLRCQPGSIRR